MTSGGLWIYSRDGMNGDANENNADSYRIDNSKTTTSIKWNTPADVK